jgi:hypothetical protein
MVLTSRQLGVAYDHAGTVRSQLRVDLMFQDDADRKLERILRKPLDHRAWEYRQARRRPLRIDTLVTLKAIGNGLTRGLPAYLPQALINLAQQHNVRLSL